jgi:lipopolysaccharide biosynthesis regulator YciM
MSIAAAGAAGYDLSVPGIRMELPQMRPVVVDEALATTVLNSSDEGDRVVVLIAQGRFSEAAEAVTEARLLEPGNLRLRLLDADVIRWNGDTDRAVRRLRWILEEVTGTADEAAVLHQLGACFYSRGDVHAAATRFRSAWEGLAAADADPVRVECSKLCYELARADLA